MLWWNILFFSSNSYLIHFHWMFSIAYCFKKQMRAFILLNLSFFSFLGLDSLFDAKKLCLQEVRTLNRKDHSNDSFFSWYFLALRGFWRGVNRLGVWKSPKLQGEREDNDQKVVVLLRNWTSVTGIQLGRPEPYPWSKFCLTVVRRCWCFERIWNGLVQERTEFHWCLYYTV